MKLIYEIMIGGRVQGVGFRYHARQRACELGLTGYVANRANGEVLVVAEGDVSALDTLLSYLQAGPPRAVIARVAVSRSPWTGQYGDFTIRY